MITDTEIKVKGIKALSAALGPVDAKRFVSLILQKPFDYTKWRANLFEGMTIEELSAKAMELRKSS